MMDENPELRWSFISKVYSILTLQLLLTVAVVSVVVFIPPVANFFNNYVPDYVLGIVVVFAQCSAELYHQKHLLSYFFLLIFNVSFALLLGSFCAFLSGKIYLEAVILTTTAVVFILTLYTFWAVKRGQDFEFLNLFLLRALLVLFIIVSIQFLFPLEKFMSTMIIGAYIGSIVYT
ncbi:hypothetical protein P8452_00186 [Trifolium repens]|nr:hypothetical protein P8452_00186 [Trifolium repens]